MTEVDTLLATVAEASSSAFCTSLAVKNLALCSAILLASAKTEVYLEELISDWGRAIAAAGVTTDALPSNVRLYLLNSDAFVGMYRRLIIERGESEFLTGATRHLAEDGFRLIRNGETISANEIRRLYAEVKYPSCKNLQRLFTRCGLMNVFDRLNQLASKDVRATMESFNNVRTEMAHEGVPPGIGVADVRRQLRELKATVGYIDRVFFSHVSATTGSRCWTR